VKEWLALLTEYAIVIIDGIALAVVFYGTVEAFIKAVPLALSPSGHRTREVWLRYARWLVAGLTFQLAADIVETSITANWQAIGRIAAVAVIRTFLNYFLERDLAEVTEKPAEPSAPRGQTRTDER
jgi:uncharacterized membrane protein